MKRAVLLIGLLVGCGDDGNKLPDGHLPDGHLVVPDAPGSGSGSNPGSGSGSSSDAMAVLDAPPHDRKLELLVASLSVVVVVGPSALRRRRA